MRHSRLTPDLAARWSFVRRVLRCDFESQFPLLLLSTVIFTLLSIRCCVRCVLRFIGCGCRYISSRSSSFNIPIHYLVRHTQLRQQVVEFGVTRLALFTCAHFEKLEWAQEVIRASVLVLPPTLIPHQHRYRIENSNTQHQQSRSSMLRLS